MSYENLFIGDFSDEQKNKICLKEPLESNSVRFEKDGFTIKLENGVELIHAENGIVIRVAQGKETPTKPTRKGKNLYCPNCDQWLLWDDAIPNEGDNYCGICGQKLDWED